MKVFISYSRANKVLASRLACDLSRAGLDPWQDVFSIRTDELWYEEILRGIGACDVFLTIVTPESSASANVEAEVTEARRSGKRVIALWAAGDPATDLKNWEARQMIAANPYWDAFPRLFADLGTPAPPNPMSLLRPGMTLGEFAQTTGGAKPFGRLIAVPVMPGPYANGYLAGYPDQVVPVQTSERTPAALLLRFTGKTEDDTIIDLASFLEMPRSNTLILYVEGPFVDGPNVESRFDIPESRTHVWQECVHLSDALVRRWGKERHSPLNVFLHAPASIAFAVGAKFREMVTPCITFNYLRGRTPMYSPVITVDRTT